MYTIFLIVPLALMLIAPKSIADDFSPSHDSLSQNSQLQINELLRITDVPVFPNTPIAPIDPLSKEKVDAVLVGPTIKADQGAGFDDYRYVTFYNVEIRKEPLTSLGILNEQCHDNSEYFGKYEFSYSFTASIEVTESLDGLGLSETLSKTQTVTTSRNVRAVGDIEATHTPYMVKQNWSGRTFIQTFTKRTGKTAFDIQVRKPSSLWAVIFFPVILHSEYPMPFDVKNANWTFQVDRKILRHCRPSADNGDAVAKTTLSRQKDGYANQQ